MKKILFVCLGNICRSPGAEAIMKAWIKKEGKEKEFLIDSAGLYSGHAGALPDERMRRHASRRGYVLDSRARTFYPTADFAEFDMIIGMDDQKNVIQSVAEKAKKAGKKVGVTTSVSVDHATPAAFYAHQPNRSMYYEIALDLPKANFDFYAGGGFLKPTTTADKKEAPSIFPMFEEAGYTIARGYNDYKAKAAVAGKMILIQEEGADTGSLPYAIDSKEGDLTLAQITESAIDFLTKGKNKGFFLMVEGGKIDWACHGNDAATVFHEVADMDNAIKVAYEFYKKHPKETLIVVTADHETGGIALGTGKYALNLKALENQKASAEVLSKKISDLRKAKNNHVAWEDIKNLLSEEMGFWSVLPITWEQEKKLRDEYEKSFVRNKVEFAELLW